MLGRDIERAMGRFMGVAWRSFFYWTRGILRDHSEITTLIRRASFDRLTGGREMGFPIGDALDFLGAFFDAAAGAFFAGTFDLVGATLRRVSLWVRVRVDLRRGAFLFMGGTGIRPSAFCFLADVAFWALGMSDVRRDPSSRCWFLGGSLRAHVSVVIRRPCSV